MNTLIKAAAIAVAALGSFAANATVTVTDNAVTHYAVGELRSAASAGSENAYIYCDMSGGIIGCGASDGAGHFLSCWSDSFNQKQYFASMTGTATLQFFANPETGRCDRIDVSNSSRAFGVSSPTATKYVTLPTVGQSYAYGSMNAPADNPNSAVSCTSADFYVECDVTDKDGHVGRCTAYGDTQFETLDDLRLAINGVNESSYVFFEWDDQGTCQDLYISNGSFYLQ